MISDEGEGLRGRCGSEETNPERCAALVPLGELHPVDSSMPGDSNVAPIDETLGVRPSRSGLKIARTQQSVE